MWSSDSPAARGYANAFRGRFSGSAGELKFFDTATSFNADLTGEVPATGQLVLIPQGVTEASRVGRKCTIKSVQCRWQVTLIPTNSGVASGVLYMYLVQDTQCNGAAAGVTDVFTSTALASAFVNLDNSSRFRIMKKWVVDLSSAAGVTTAYNDQSRSIEYYTKCNIPLEFSSTTGAIGELKSNNIFLVAGVNRSAVDDFISVAGAVRVRFTDS